MGPSRRVILLSVAAFSLNLSTQTSLPAAEPRPEIERLQVFPERLELSGARDSRRLLVTGFDSQGRPYDLSREATLTPVNEHVTIDADGFVVPATVGNGKLQISAAGKQAEIEIAVKDVSAEPISFIREIIPLTSKVGCNSGTCHGAQQGKNGFKLSLRGYDPLYDYRALVDDLSGRRFNRSVPSQSLMLLKPTQGVPHEGGFLFDEQSRYYKLIETWIAEGCRYESVQRVDRIEVFPKKPLLQRDDDAQQLIVLAYYPDGTSRDVTRDAVFDTSDFEVVTVSQSGLIEAVRRGEAAALVRYEGKYAAAPVTVLGDREGYQWQESPEFNYVDTHVNAKLQRMKLLASDLCTDAEFLRRVSLDLVGLPPTPEQVREFLADTRDTQVKRTAKIDELMDSPGFIDHWSLKWSDLLMNNRKYVKEKGVWAFRNWIRSAVATNMPYDQFVYELMTASGSTLENPAANYYRISREPKDVMENMTQVFLGTRFNCNQCHDHPFERWTQTQYYELSGFFASVGRKPGSGPDEEIIFSLASSQPVVHPGTGEAVQASFPFGDPEITDPQADPRLRLAQWLTSPENPYFAKSVVNRYWSYFLGRGIIDPVDDIRASNPPSNPELLTALTEDFISRGFDLRQLIRTIVTSHTYQRSIETNSWNTGDTVNFSHAVARRLSAEQLYDSIITATGAPRNLPGVPAGFRAVQLPDSNVDVTFLDMFGRPPRESPCECERTSDVSLRQTLNLINGPTIGEAIIHPEGRLAGLLKAETEPKQLVEEVYLAVLCRLPNREELDSGIAYMTEVGDKKAAAEDLMWALINSPAFLFNR